MEQQIGNPALCEKCSGTGWEVLVEGNVSRARRCSCSKTIEGDRLFAAAKIPPRYLACDFDSFKPCTMKQGQARNLATNYAIDYPLLDKETFREKSLLFTGGSGRGKTHLAVAVLKGLLKKGLPCLFVDFHDLLVQIRGSYDEVSQNSEYEILRPVLNIDILLLDDLGSQRMSEWVQDTIFYIINHRYSQNKPVIATTNLGLEPGRGTPIESLQDRLGYRVVSRLYEMCTCFELDGPDYRKNPPPA